jgi:Flp pilus assembly protein TadG
MLGAVRLLRRSTSLFRRDAHGSITMVMGIAAVPLFMAAAVALNMSQASRMRAELQAAADAGALASAVYLSEGRSKADRIDIAQKTFNQNISAALLAQLKTAPSVDVSFPARQVILKVKAATDRVFYKGLVDMMNLGVQSTVQVDHGTPICLLTLNPTAAKALYLNGTADLVADKCAVQVNSSNSSALLQSGAGTATADSFCVNGNYSGNNFSPVPQTRCATEDDPLAASFTKDWTDSSTNTSTCNYTNVPTISSASDSTVTELAPGVYCGGLTIHKGTVHLQTGRVYVFKDGMLDIHAHATVTGDHVTILLTGNSSTRLNTQAGASLDISAPSSGLFAGIAIAQDPASIPSSENLVIGGGQVEVNGILYFPKQPLKVTGNGQIGTQSDQFAIIADTVSIEGNGQLTIAIGQDYQSAGLPPLSESHEVLHIVN